MRRQRNGASSTAAATAHRAPTADVPQLPDRPDGSGGHMGGGTVVIGANGVPVVGDGQLGHATRWPAPPPPPLAPSLPSPPTPPSQPAHRSMVGGGFTKDCISRVELLEDGKLSMTTTPPEGDGGATRVVGIVTQVGMGPGRKAAGSKQPVVLSAAAIEVRLQLPNPVTAYPLVTVSLHRRRCSRSVACPRHQGRMAIGGRGRGIHRRRSSRKPVACCDAQSLPRSRRSLPRLIKSFGMEWSRPRPHVVNGTCAD